MKSHSDRAEFLEVALDLERGRTVCRREVAARFGVHQRTVERWLEDVERVLPLERVRLDSGLAYRKVSVGGKA